MHNNKLLKSSLKNGNLLKCRNLQTLCKWNKGLKDYDFLTSDFKSIETL